MRGLPFFKKILNLNFFLGGGGGGFFIVGEGMSNIFMFWEGDGKKALSPPSPPPQLLM